MRFAPEPGTETWRRPWVFVMTLAYSRYRFVHFVERQDVASWLDCHVQAFEFFHGVPETVLLDNLKAGVVCPDRYDPKLNRGYQALEHHYGFVVDPPFDTSGPVATPEYKGKVERAIPMVRQQLLAGRVYRDLTELNAPFDTSGLLHWCREGVGRAVHGTTQEAPWVRFERDEQACLKPLPATPFYPAPGRGVLGRGTHQDPPARPAPRHLGHRPPFDTSGDYPPRAQAFLFAHPAYCRQKAEELGPHVAQRMEQILASHALRQLRKAQALLRYRSMRLADKYGAQRLDEACGHLLAFECTELKRLKRLLEHGLPAQSASPAVVSPALSPQALGFLHPPESFAAGGEVRP